MMALRDSEGRREGVRIREGKRESRMRERNIREGEEEKGIEGEQKDGRSCGGREGRG